MEQYISKSALLAEIEKRKHMCDFHHGEYWDGCYNTMEDLISFLDTLEAKGLPIWEKVSPDTGQTTLYKDGGKSYLERFGYRIELKDLDKLPKKNLKAQKGEEV